MKTMGTNPSRSDDAQERFRSGKADVLRVRDLWVSYSGGSHATAAVRGVTFDVAPGARVGIVGESGSGKSTVLLSIMRLLPAGASIDSGSIEFAGVDLTVLPERELERIRGTALAIVFQNAVNSLNPLIRVGVQIEDVLVAKQHLTKAKARSQAIAILDSMGVVDAARRARDYPFQFSGGMAQRAAIGLSLACAPIFLLADEPTTGLDPLIQDEVLALIRQRVLNLNAGLLLVSHDIHVIAEVCTSVVVMYAGEALEVGPVEAVLRNPVNPYTRALVAASDLLPGSGAAYIPGRVPTIDRAFQGCSFSGRCPLEASLNNPAICREHRPRLQDVRPGHSAACHFLHEGPIASSTVSAR